MSWLLVPMNRFLKNRSQRLVSGTMACLLLATLLVATLSQAEAAVSASGSVSPIPPITGGSFPSTTLTVGDEDATNPSLIGELTVNGGTQLLYDRLVLGNEAEYLGFATVTGAGTQLELDSSFVSNPGLQVGDEGTGYLTVGNRARVWVSNDNGNAVLGREAEGRGYVTVENFLSQFVVGEDLIIGDLGYGEFVLRGGAFAYHSDPNTGTVNLGAQFGGIGIATVDGDRTQWHLPQTTLVGGAGAGIGTLRITNGGTVDANNDLQTINSLVTVGPNGVMHLADGRFFGETLVVTGRLQGDGWVNASVIAGPTGEITAAANEHLRFTGSVANEGLVTIQGDETGRGEIEFTGALTNTDPGGTALPGRITVSDGTLRFGQALTNAGILSSTSGVTNFHGEITNGATGLIAIGGNSNATFYDNVDVTAGTLSIAAGSTALFLGDLTISPGSTVEIDLSQSSANSPANAPLQVLGTTQLEAPIRVNFVDGYVPTAGDNFSLLSATGGMVPGLTNTSNFEPLPTGLMWDLVQGENGLSVRVIDDPSIVIVGAIIDGDFNSDGQVDSADYTVWRDSLGQSGDSLPADANGSGSVDAEDLAIWRTNFGTVASTVAVTAVPEPTAMLLGLSLISLIASQRLTRKQ